jgi:RNA polymerase sigma-70 factor (ECF subfamily)
VSRNKYSGVDKSVVKQVRFHAYKLKKRLPNWQIEDLEQELMLEVWSAMKLFNPGVGKFQTFIRCVLEKRARNLVKKNINGKTGRDFVFVPLSDNLNCCDEQETKLEIKCFIDKFVGKLPHKYRILCEMLRHHSVVDIAKILDVSENTIYKRLVDLRRYVKIIELRNERSNGD